MHAYKMCIAYLKCGCPTALPFFLLFLEATLGYSMMVSILLFSLANCMFIHLLSNHCFSSFPNSYTYIWQKSLAHQCLSNQDRSIEDFFRIF